MTLPAIPQPGAAIALSDVVAIEARIAHEVTTLEDIDALEEMRAKAEALAHYLQGKELHGPMLGAQRRIEARIGQLLGEAEVGRPAAEKQISHAREIKHSDRNRFRTLARGFSVLTDEEWRQSRAALLKLINQRAPMPRRTPDVVVTADGSVKKTRAERAKEIAQLASEGYRAYQIAEELGIGEQQVRKLAKAEGITLPDASLAQRREIDPHRVVESIVTGLEGSAISLRTIGKNLSGITAEEASIWAASLGDSISNLKRLRSALLEISNGRAHRAA
ncbi:MAG: hypothetical protein ACT4O5_15785 [Gammaproteobacteria bacterium]